MADLWTLPFEEFPELLREIPDAPRSLYIRGALPPPGHKLLAVVGSRRMTSYGRQVCEHLVSGLAGYPLSIVSGLALGIDGCAHQAALNSGLHTMVVTGSGLNDDVLYPRAHRRLAKDILKANGALISEEVPDFVARIESFPKRNRIMAGMCHATLVIEATGKSGTLITARLATDYNRDVLTVPGSIFSENSEGPLLLLKLGATPVKSAADVLEALGFEKDEVRQAMLFTPEEERVMKALVEPMPRDELLRALKLTAAEGNALLLSMELKGMVTEKIGLVRKNG